MILIVSCFPMEQGTLFAADRSRQSPVSTSEFQGKANSDHLDRSVVVLSQFPSQISAKIMEGLIRTLGNVHVELRMDLTEIKKISRFIHTFGITRERPRVVVCFGTVLSERVKAILPEGIPLISVLSTIPETDLERKVGGVVLSYPPERTLSVLKKLVPAVSKIGILLSKDASPSVIANSFDAESIDLIEKTTGFKILIKRVIKSSDMASAVAILLKETDAIYLVQDKLILKPDNVRYILGKALRARVPVIGLSDSYVRAGALFCLKQDFVDVGCQLGRKILNIQSLKDDELFDYPDRVIVVINQKVLKILGRRLPRSIKGNQIELIQ